MKIVILIDGSQQRPPVAFKGNYDLGPGLHIFVRSRGRWLQRVSSTRGSQVSIGYLLVHGRLIQTLENLWTNAKKTTRSDDDVDFLELLLVLDASRCLVQRAAAEERKGIDETERVDHISDDVLPELEEALDRLDETLDNEKTLLEFTKHLLDHGAEIHQALHLIAIGDPTGITSLLLIVFAAAGHTFADEHDLDSIGIDLLEKAAPKP